ncbi:hypothetical protein H4696_005286 [Amycolatopsis lexingtonensis]|uniref:DUF2537 domain-containing protein n=2 Tax=Amycolatopsis lexingtonensis TaxID=218822 RepID=A0ABR9I4R6_9PSEU|nr:hypothetical protein [Amycolatopsis lexingtonensis]MBE1498186.1 hypothetical protein [Amycolatopsis lexingtonensis]
MALGCVLIALGIAAGGALLLIAGLASGGRDWAGSGPLFAWFVAAVAWTVLAGGAAVWAARRKSWLAGLPCVVLGAVPAAVVAVTLR